MLVGCAKVDYDLNPWTTVLKQVYKASYDETRVKVLADY